MGAEEDTKLQRKKSVKAKVARQKQTAIEPEDTSEPDESASEDKSEPDTVKESSSESLKSDESQDKKDAKTLVKKASIEEVKLGPKKSVEEKKVEKPKPAEAEPVFAGLKLKKSKRVIHKPEEHKMETVKLVKQQFEPLPTNEQEEMTTRAIMTKADKPIKPIKEKPKKKKK